MSLLETLRADLLTARKVRDTVTTGLLTALVGEAAMVGKNDGNRDSTDDEVLATIRKFVKSAEEMRKLLADRPHTPRTDDTDEVTKNAREIEILTGYLPQQATEDQVKAAIAQLKGAKPDAKMGDFMSHLGTLFGANVDRKRASVLVKEALS